MIDRLIKYIQWILSESVVLHETLLNLNTSDVTLFCVYI